jgi:hypothetical protein
MNRKNEVGCSNLSLHLFAARALVCSILALVLVVGGAHATTLSLTETAGGPTLVGQSDAVSAFSYSVGSGQFVSVLDNLSPVIFQDVANGTLLFEIDLTGPDIGTLSFQNVHFTDFVVGTNANENVSFTFGTLTITPASVPLRPSLPLFAIGLGALGLLGWRRQRRALA